MSRRCLLALAVVLACVTNAAGPMPVGPEPARAATCAGYTDQAAAQAAADTRDADGDGVYCVISPR